LGPDVLLWVANTLDADPHDSYDGALARRNELLDLARWSARNRLLIRLLALLDEPRPTSQSSAAPDRGSTGPAGHASQTDSA
jgi:hypothetical protein